MDTIVIVALLGGSLGLYLAALLWTGRRLRRVSGDYGPDGLPLDWSHRESIARCARTPKFPRP
jgi:hypothetical protein